MTGPEDVPDDLGPCQAGRLLKRDEAFWDQPCPLPANSVLRVHDGSDFTDIGICAGHLELFDTMLDSMRRDS